MAGQKSDVSLRAQPSRPAARAPPHPVVNSRHMDSLNRVHTPPRQAAGAACCPTTRSYSGDRAAALRASSSRGRASTRGTQASPQGTRNVELAGCLHRPRRGAITRFNESLPHGLTTGCGDCARRSRCSNLSTSTYVPTPRARSARWNGLLPLGAGRWWRCGGRRAAL